ncbi:hypothetical protein [Cupriavidus sp. WS]|uniref:hypothetical protein n=1 Tax=Cupriavidus sp. WS TaxID=1312922 RepID=UPI000362EB1B|nr:hypothetical protein [Cupriavidus sp. WS]
MNQTIDTERERWAENLSVAVRSLRKYGFLFVQDPDATAMAQPDQERQAREAACFLLAVPATTENLSAHAVHNLASALLENGAAALDRIRGRV